MRIAVVGLGFMGATHLKGWKQIPNVEIVAVCSEDPKKRDGDLSSIQGNLGGPGEKFDFTGISKYSKLTEVLQDPQVDAVDLCIPTHLHASAAIEALRAGKHVLVEKPMALDPEQAAQMIEEAKRSGKLLMVAQVLRFLPSYRAMADAVQSGKYGPLRSVVFDRRCAAPAWSQWLGNPEQSGGGVFDLLIHDIDFALHLFGYPESVSATGYEDLPNGVDILHANLLYPDSTSVLITGGWHHRKAFPFSMAYTVVTDGGTFDFSSAGDGGVTLYTADGETKALELSPVDGFEAELRYFTECVEEGKAPSFCPPEESAAAVKLARRLLDARREQGQQLAAGA
jgi:predicted dehydrogenase